MRNKNKDLPQTNPNPKKEVMFSQSSDLLQIICPGPILLLKPSVKIQFLVRCRNVVKSNKLLYTAL